MPKGYTNAELEVTDPALFETYRPHLKCGPGSGPPERFRCHVSP
jgi:hypothetical protein